MNLLVKQKVLIEKVASLLRVIQSFNERVKAGQNWHQVSEQKSFLIALILCSFIELSLFSFALPVYFLIKQ